MIDALTTTHDTTTIISESINMTDTIDTGVVAGQVPRLGEAPSFCRLCNMQLNSGDTFRAHAKSDLHVYNLRMKVAEPHGTTSPPTPPRSDSPCSEKGATSGGSRRRYSHADTSQDESEEDDNDESDSASEEAEVPEFIPGQCIFCPEEFDDLDSSLDHMATSHGFNVPFQEFLAVDLETVIWYLHFVINGYKECISCGTRRKTPEAAQQHMIARGHCRFDITGDMEDFYEMPQQDNVILEKTQNDATGTVRLPSGKLISNRNYQETPEPRQRQARSNSFLDTITAGPADPPSPRKASKSSSRASADQNAGTDVASRRGQEGHGGRMVRSSEALLAAQLSRLVLAGDRAQIRLEARKRGKMERKNNKILQKHFKVDAGDGRSGRQFGG